MKALVAFGTKYGSTARVADEIATVLRGMGVTTDVRDLRRGGGPDPAAYDLLVLGSSIVMGGWSKGALRFLERNGPAVSGKRVALFACCASVLTDPGRVEEHERKYLAEVAARFGIAEPVAMGLFGGEIDFGKYGFLTKAVVRSVMRDPLRDLEGRGIDIERPYDFRDWDAIRRWARSLCEGVGVDA